MSSRLPLLPSPPPCRPVAPPLPRSMAESRMAMGGAEGGVEATEEERGERTRTRSGRRRVEETSHTTPMEPPSPPRSTGCSRRLVRRRGLCLQATTGCFLQNQRRRDEPRKRVVRALTRGRLSDTLNRGGKVVPDALYSQRTVSCIMIALSSNSASEVITFCYLLSLE